MDWKNIVNKFKPQKLWFEAHGCMIHAHRWAHSEACTVVFIHGSMSNNVWWQPIAASLTKGIVLSIDLSGHGLSEWDKGYDIQKHAKEVIKLIELYAKGDVYLIGHSYGGHVAGYVNALQPCKKVVMVDSPLHFSAKQVVAKNTVHSYPSIEKACERFKPLPPQPVEDKELLEWIAKQSIREIEGGYAWQFDPKTLNKEYSEALVDIVVKGLKNNAIWWYGELSPFANEKAKQMAEYLEIETEMIPNAYHAVMLDAPDVLLSKIKRMIGD